MTAHVRCCPAGTSEQRMIDAAVDGLAALWPECAERIVGSRAWTSRGLEHDLGLPGGHLEHGDWALDQLLFLRPDARCLGGATPLNGLFVCGPGYHPGIALHGGSALWAAQLATR